MAFTVLKSISQDELNWQRETHYWMRISDEKTMKRAAKQEGLAEGRAEGRTQGSTEKAVEAALTIIRKYKVSPEEAAKDVGAPLDKVLEALK